MDERPTVLVVEDEPFIREILADFLEDGGFSVRCAETTSAGFEELERAQDIFAALIDIDLEVKGGGFLVARYAHERHPDTLIIYTSGGAQPRLAQEQVDASLFLPKPYHPSRLCTLLRDRLPRQGATAAAA